MRAYTNKPKNDQVYPDRVSYLLDTDIVIVRAEKTYNTYGDAILFSYYTDDETVIRQAQTNSAILITQILEQIELGLPVRVRIEQRDGAKGRIYYTLSEPAE